MAELYQTTRQNISLHIQNIYEEGELSQGGTVKKYLTVQGEGSRTVSRQLEYYNLDVIIAVGYRVKSGVATRSRQWATERLREYLIKGFTLDDERLKGRNKLADYFDELLARIREIRASEARVYQRIREIFALASDYVEDEQATQVFFAMMQNKMHYAAAGMTAAEIIRRRARDEQRRLSTMSRGRYAFLPPKDDSTTPFGPDSALLRVVQGPPRPESLRHGVDNVHFEDYSTTLESGRPQEGRPSGKSR